MSEIEIKAASIRQAHDARSGYPPEHYYHDAVVFAKEAFLVWEDQVTLGQKINDEEARIAFIKFISQMEEFLQ